MPIYPFLLATLGMLPLILGLWCAARDLSGLIGEVPHADA